MNKVFAAVIAGIFGLVSISGFAADSMKKDEMKKEAKTEPKIEAKVAERAS